MMLGTVAFNEGGLLLYGTLAVGWMLTSFQISNVRFQMRAVAIAGAMAGLACGVKYTAVPILLVIPPLAIMLVARLPWRALLLNCTVYVFAGLLLFLPWIARNAAWTGNPVFPEAMALLGQGHFTDDQVHRWERAHEPRDDQRGILQRLKAFAKEVIIDWRYGFALIPLGGVAAIMTIRDRRTVFLVVMLAALSVFWMALTHLQSRFFVLAVPLAALMLGRVGWWQARLAIFIIAVMLSLPGWSRVKRVLLERIDAVGHLAGLHDLAIFLPPEVAQHVQAKSRLALVGDAKAFLYTLPMSNLCYRTVFDVDVSEAKDAIDAWLGDDAAQIRGTHYLVVDRPELERFSKTYLKSMPPLPALPSGQPIVVIPPGP
jgi:4-amino-4-deoxy-L-arabinose transferase-like glycosyltransferase